MKCFYRFATRALCVSALLFAAVSISTIVTHAQNPPPGAIFDLANTPEFSGGALTTQTMFTTSFVGDGNVEYVSFAFREQPDWFLFVDPSVTAGASSTNLLNDPNFQSATFGQNCNHDNSLGCPPGWGAWIQPVDTSAIGQVATPSLPEDCGNEVGAISTNFWCDGSVQGYDGIYQGIATTLGTTYNISWLLDDNSGQAINNPTIDMLVYAGDNIPVGTVSIGAPGVPEASSLSLLIIGLAGLLLAATKNRLQTSS